MAAKSDERMTEDFQEQPGGTLDESLDGTDSAEELHQDSAEGMSCSQAKKRRIVYDKEFLVECFQHPASAKKPSEFPLPNLECTLGTARLGKNPFSVPYVAPKRKEENGKKEKEAEDNISLRPHSGNFSSGCAPNLSPAHVPHNSYTRFQMHEDQSRNTYDRDRDMSRNNYRFLNNGRLEIIERSRPDRDRERDREREMRERDTRDRGSDRDRGIRIQPRRPNSHLNWGAEPEQSDWNRRRNNGTVRQDMKDNRRGYYDKRDDDQEPEWFSGGPTSQHETIELRGFMDDERREHPKDKMKNSANLNSVGNSSEASTNSTSDGSTSAKSNDEGPSEESNEMDLSIEKILKMDHISGILPNGLLEDEEQPSGSSRFSQLFQRNSTPIHIDESVNKRLSNESSGNKDAGGLASLFQKKDGEEKSIVIQEMENALRNILLTSKKQEEIPEKPANSDMNAFKMLLQQVVQGNKTGPAEPDHKDSPIIHGMGPPPGLSPGIIQNKVQQPENLTAGTYSNRNNHAEAFSDLLKMSPQNTPHANRDASSGVDNKRPQPANHMHVLNTNQPARKSASAQPLGDPFKKSNNRTMTPAQFLHLLPPDVQHLVANASVDYDFVMRPEVSKIVTALTNGEIAMGEILEQLAAPRSPHRLILVGIVKLCLHGAFSLPNIVIKPVLPRNSAPPGNGHPQQKMNFYKKGADEGREFPIQRSSTPVSSMAFTPTAVMRKMTAEQQQSKSTPPASQNSFPVFASSSSIATHQAALVNAMSAMNQVQPYPHPNFGGFVHGRHPYPVMMPGPGNPPEMSMHGVPIRQPRFVHPARNLMPMPGVPFPFRFQAVATYNRAGRFTGGRNHNHTILNQLMGNNNMKMYPPPPDTQNQKNNLSDDLTKLLTSGGPPTDGVRNSAGPQHPMALSLEEVEKMQLRGHAPKYQ